MAGQDRRPAVRELAKAGLVTPRQSTAVSQAALGDFLESYITGRTDIKPRTRINLDAPGGGCWNISGQTNR